ncbi:MAG: hypothetical protein ACFFAS_14625 [Promethearchaeota archaeon]
MPEHDLDIDIDIIDNLTQIIETLRKLLDFCELDVNRASGTRYRSRLIVAWFFRSLLIFIISSLMIVLSIVLPFFVNEQNYTMILVFSLTILITGNISFFSGILLLEYLIAFKFSYNMYHHRIIRGVLLNIQERFNLIVYNDEVFDNFKEKGDLKYLLEEKEKINNRIEHFSKVFGYKPYFSVLTKLLKYLIPILVAIVLFILPLLQFTEEQLHFFIIYGLVTVILIACLLFLNLYRIIIHEQFFKRHRPTQCDYIEKLTHYFNIITEQLFRLEFPNDDSFIMARSNRKDKSLLFKIFLIFIVVLVVLVCVLVSWIIISSYIA